MRTVRSYRTAWDVQTVMQLVVKGSGTDFNPLLVDNFLRGLGRMSALS